MTPDQSAPVARLLPLYPQAQLVQSECADLSLCPNLSDLSGSELRLLGRTASGVRAAGEHRDRWQVVEAVRPPQL
jgi:hypothetical protein